MTALEKAEVEKRLEIEREAKRRLRDEEADVPLTPREWLSDTAALTAAEIEAMTVNAKRALIKQTVVLRKKSLIGAAPPFQPFADRVLNLKAPKVSQNRPADTRPFQRVGSAACCNVGSSETAVLRIKLESGCGGYFVAVARAGFTCGCCFPGLLLRRY